MRIIGSLLCVSLGSGCSFIFSQHPPEGHERLAYFDCTSGGAAPASDVIGAVFSGLVVIGAATNDERSESDRNLALIFGTSAAVTTASAIYGFVSNASCSDAKAHLAHRLVRSQVELSEARKAAASKSVANDAAASAAPGCSRDVDCKGDRICTNQICVAPPTPPSPAASEAGPISTEPSPVPSQSFPVTPPVTAPSPNSPP